MQQHHPLNMSFNRAEFWKPSVKYRKPFGLRWVSRNTPRLAKRYQEEEAFALRYSKIANHFGGVDERRAV